MQFSELRKRIQTLYGPILTLADILPLELRRTIERSLNIALIILAGIAVILFAISHSRLSEVMLPFDTLASAAWRLYGLFLIVFAARFVFTALEAFHRSYYFRGLAHLLTEPYEEGVVSVSFEVASIVHATPQSDITGGFVLSSIGQEILFRAGVSERPFGAWLQKRTPRLTGEGFFLDTEPGVMLPTYIRSVYKQDKEFVQFLAEQQITGDELGKTAEWVMRNEHKERLRARWWSRDNLGRVPGIGKTWAYGMTYLLERYGHEITKDPFYKTAVENVHEEDDEVEALEAVLAKGHDANTLLVGAEGSGKRKRIAQLSYKIREGHCLPQLEDKRLFLLDVESILSRKKDKPAFEAEFMTVLNHAMHAGNIIVVIESLAAVVESAAALGTDFVDLIRPYLTAEELHIVFTADPDSFHAKLERDMRLMQHVEIVRMHDMASDGLLQLLEQRALAVERRTGVAYSLPALEAIARAADRYFPEGVMPDKAFDLLEEVAPYVADSGGIVVERTDVEEMVTKKTGVPVGAPGEKERDELLHLEDILHKRVVGQEKAVGALARALRRARSGIEPGDRPIGAFLFLGPTGVGKTETAKSLATALFHNEDTMHRLDMSEFQGDDALRRLIGGFESGQPGVLASMLRERQYGVLLLDEFEKSARDVHDLFLQVLDEGAFTDAAGKKVNARNLVIIATSNAGADLIWDWFRQGKKIVEQKQELVDALITKGILRPELLNRFDDIILFHPLTDANVRSIAHMQLHVLREQLAEKGIEFVVSPALIDEVARAGYDPKFGGRPMRRVIKERVEQVVADRMLAGAIKSGDKVELSPDDLPG